VAWDSKYVIILYPLFTQFIQCL